MGYKGVKFETKMIGNSVPDHPHIDKLVYWCKIFHEKGLAPTYEGGSYGNLSFRLKDNSFIITASNSSLEDTTDETLVTVNDISKGVVEAIGKKKPSSEAMVHHIIYTARPDVNAVFHGHCAYISENAEKLGIPMTNKEEPYGTQALVERVLETLGDHNFIEMRNHGFISMGKTMDDAGVNALRYLEKKDQP